MLISLLRCGSATLLLAATILVAAPTTADAEFEYSFDLHNHPDGNAQDPQYGLRLDELYDWTTGHDVFTFDFDYSDLTGMTMTVADDNTVVISGTVYGGRNDNSDGYAAPAYWDVSFTFAGAGVTIDETGGELVSIETSGGVGTISTDSFGGLEFDLTGFMDPSFIFERGHRLPNTHGDPWTGDNNSWTGRGWLNVNGRDHIESQDWLFIAEPSPDSVTVPAPPSLALFALGALGLVPGMKRRRKQADA